MLLEEFAASADEQAALERRVLKFYRELTTLPAGGRREHLALQRDAHAAYISKGLSTLPAGFISLDASRPWLVFWMVHSLALLQRPLPPEVGASHHVKLAVLAMTSFPLPVQLWQLASVSVQMQSPSWRLCRYHRRTSWPSCAAARAQTAALAAAQGNCRTWRLHMLQSLPSSASVVLPRSRWVVLSKGRLHCAMSSWLRT